MDLSLASTPTSSASPPRPWARCHRKLPALVHLRLTISTFQSSMVSKTGEVSAFLFQPQNSEMKDIQIDRDSFSSIQY
uniref:Uncharacterized protein n=1 Tax=Oryza rufipogon TaxID=4529 RepID=A0A0E0QFZ0_ORYRU